MVVTPSAAVTVYGEALVRSGGHAIDTILLAMVAMILTAVSYGRMAALCLLIGGIFVYAGAVKALAPAEFLVQVRAYGLLSAGPWERMVAGYLPYLELVAGGALALGWRRGGALVILTGLSAGFLVALLSAQLRGLDIACGCFGEYLGGESMAAAIIRDVALLAGLILLWRNQSRAEFTPGQFICRTTRSSH